MGGGEGGSYSRLNNYFDNYKLELLDEWLEEDKKEILSEDGITDFANSVGSWTSGAWDWLKGLVTGTDTRMITPGSGTSIGNRFTGTAVDKALFGGNSKAGSGGLAGWIKSFGRDEKGNPVTNGEGISGWLKSSANKLGDFMRDNPNATTGALAAAGLLGTYYLYRKWKNNKNKKLDQQTLQTAIKDDQIDPSKIPASERNKPAKA